MQYVRPDVSTLCMGIGASMGAVLLAAGEPGKRVCLPHSRIMIHQPWMGGVQGPASDINIQAQEILKSRERLNAILAEHTGQTLEVIARDTDRDYYMSAEEARALWPRRFGREGKGRLREPDERLRQRIRQRETAEQVEGAASS